MNLAQTLAHRNITQPKKLKCFRTSKELELTASASNEFFLVKVPVSKLALSASTKKTGDAVVIDRNTDKIGRTVGGFIPKVMIMAGHNTVTAAIAKGDTFINVWAGTGAIRKLRIMADDSISSNELQTKLSALIQNQYAGRNSNSSDCCTPAYPWIREIYPFENYVIFDWEGNQWKQAFVLDPVTREAALVGKPVKVFQEYSETPKGMYTDEGAKAAFAEKTIRSAAALPVMPSSRAVQYYTSTLTQEQDFDPINNGMKPLGALTPGNMGHPEYTSFGAPSSEYANPPLKLMMNIEEALRMYLASIADGTHTPINRDMMANSIMAGSHPNEYSECEVAIRAAKATVNVVDFMAWQRTQLNEKLPLKDGLYASGYAYVGDSKDVSTWHCAMDSLKSIKYGLQVLAQTNFVPKKFRANAKEKLEAAAKKLKATAIDNSLPGGYRPPPASVAADAEVATTMLAKKKKKKKT